MAAPAHFVSDALYSACTVCVGVCGAVCVAVCVAVCIAVSIAVCVAVCVHSVFNVVVPVQFLL